MAIDTITLKQILNKPIYVVPERHVVEAGSLTDLPDHEGENRKGIVILYNDPIHSHLQDEERILFDKILLALKLTLQDIALINLSGQTYITFTWLTEVLDVKYIVMFENNPKQIRLNILADKNKPCRFKGIGLLFTDSLSMIRDDVSRKQNLWEGLQALFNTAK